MFFAAVPIYYVDAFFFSLLIFPNVSGAVVFLVAPCGTCDLVDSFPRRSSKDLEDARVLMGKRWTPRLQEPTRISVHKVGFLCFLSVVAAVYCQD